MKISTPFINCKKLLPLVVFLLCAFANAQLQTPFTPRFNEPVNGDFTIIANNTISTTATGDYNGTADNNSLSNLVYVDIDSDPTTFNSSSADFLNPAPGASCLTLKKVLLYWAASDQEPTPGGDNQPNWNFNDVKLMLPSQAAYTTYTADEVIYRGKEVRFSYAPYICVKDITSDVNTLANPFGTYQIANVEGKIGSLNDHQNGLATGVSGGWQIVFVYESPTLPAKNVTIFDGYAHVLNQNGAKDYDINFSGFQTIPTGDVNANILIGALEGDRGIGGDRLQIQNTSNVFVDLSTAPLFPIRSSLNFFNSRITIDNNNFSDRRPASENTLGFDAAVFELSNPGNSIIGNNQTSATVRLTSTQEAYGLYLLGLSVDVWAPNLSPIELVLDAPTTTSNPGDTLGVSFGIENTGNDDALGLEVSTTLPPQVSLVEPISPALPSGVTYNYNATTRLLEFVIDDSVVEAGDDEVVVNFDIQINNECYFLEDDCDLDFDLQLEANYTGDQNPAPQTTNSSATLDECGVGNKDPLTITINQPLISWQTLPNALNRTVECGNTTDLNDAQSLAPVADKCNLTPVKTSGSFVADANCANAGTYTNTWTFTDACGVTISDFTQVITVTDTTAPTGTAPTGNTNVNACYADAQSTYSFDANTVASSYSDNCGSVTVNLTNTELTGDNCSWSLTYTYNVVDDCGNTLTGETITHSGSDQTAPTGTAPTGNTNVNACYADAQSTYSFDANTIASSYSDNCGSVTVNLTNTELTGDNCSWSLTYTYNVVDDCGNTLTGETITHSGSDQTAPTGTAPTGNTNANACYADAQSTYSFDANTVASSYSDNCGSVTVNLTNTELTGDNCSWSLTYTYNVVDDCGNTITGETITHSGSDQTAPTGTAPTGNTNANACYADAQSTYSFDANTIASSYSDNCGSVTVNLTNTELTGDNCSWSLTYTYNVVDDCGNTITGETITHSGSDQTAPIIDNTNTQNIEIECGVGDTTTTLQDWLDNNAGATATDNCGNVTWSNNYGADDSVQCDNGAVTVTFTATDECGLTATTTATYLIKDTEAPTLTIPSNTTAECDDDLTPATQGNATATDNCSAVNITFTDVTTPGTCANSYVITRTWTATDACNNATSLDQIITVQDTTAPVITLPSNTTVECSDDLSTTALGSAAATDNCSAEANITITFSDVTTPGTCANSYVITRTWTATDECNNASSLDQIITVEDNTAPIITLPANVTAECSDDLSTTALGTATANDNCSAEANITISSSDVTTPGACPGTYVITRTWTATDECNNTVSQDQTITVQDTTAPIIDNTNTQNIEIECGVGDTTTTLQDWLDNNAGATATDNCGNVTWSNNYGADDSVQCDNGAVTVTFTATDECGLTATTTATYLIKDTEAPTLTIPSNTTAECDDDLTPATQGNATATDNCSAVNITFTDVTTPGTCANSYVITRTWTATDACNNATSLDQIITVQDTTAPVITLPSNTTVECSDDLSTTALGSAAATDNCSAEANITITFSDVTTPGTCANSYVITRTWTATDECNNASSLDQIITVEDNTAPIITLPANVTAECSDDLSTTALGTATANDNCSAVANITISSSDVTTPGACPGTYVITRTWTATDECNNTVSQDQTITVQDTTAPVIDNTNTQNIEIECGVGDTTTTLQDWLNNNAGATATDNCGNVTWSNNYGADDSVQCDNGAVTVTFTATDECGLTATTTATYLIKDTEAPIVETTNGDLDRTVECSDASALTAALSLVPAATDDCSATVLNLVSDVVNQEPNCPNGYVQIRTWNFTDSCGNTSESFTQTITVVDTTAPELILPPNVSAECSDDLSPASYGTATATDNCDDNPSVTFTDVITEGDCEGTYTITRTWSTTDACGNTFAADQIITVSDTTAPEFDQSELPENITVECDDIPEAVTLTATDNCGDATVTFEEIITNGDCPSNYTITRTYTARDDCGITNTHVQTITVQDTTAPTFVETLPAANIVVECNNIPEAETLTATDSCGSATVTVEDVRTDGDCASNYTLARTWTATDACGLTTTHTQIITVQDTTAPTFTSDLPSNITVECDAIPDAETLTATDNCGDATVTHADAITNGNCPNNYIIARTWTATDECGLTATHTQLITVQDTKAPLPTTTFEETLEVSCTDIPEIPELEFEDNCSSKSSIIVVFNETSTYEEGVFEDYQIVRTWTVRDECNNEAVYTQTLNVILDEVILDIVAPDWCFEEGIIDMNSLLPGDINTNGTWEMIEGDTNATLTQNIFDPSTLELSLEFLPDSGGINYLFRYTTTHDGCINITEITMNVHADCVVLPCGEKDVEISTALTPNGDAHNETFEIAGIDLCGFTYQVQIYNRWGALVFESDDYQNDWDGSSTKSAVGAAGKVPNGTYYYIIKIKDSGLPPFTGPLYIGTK